MCADRRHRDILARPAKARAQASATGCSHGRAIHAEWRNKAAHPAISSTQNPGHLAQRDQATRLGRCGSTSVRNEREQAEMQTQRHSAAHWQRIVLGRRSCRINNKAEPCERASCEPWRSAPYLAHASNSKAARHRFKPNSADISGKRKRSSWTCTRQSSSCTSCRTSCRPPQLHTRQRMTRAPRRHKARPTLAAYVEGKLDT